VGVTFFNGTPNEQMIGPFNGAGGIDVAPLGLLTRGDGKTIDYAGALAFDDGNPDYGLPDFSAVSEGFVGGDNLQVLGYGMVTFTNSPDPFVGSFYTIGTWSDAGATLWIDLDNNGKFEENGAKGNELVHNANSFHTPRIDITDATIPAGTYRFAAGYYEGGDGGVMDFRIVRGTSSAGNYNELKANFEPFGPASTVVSKMSSILRVSNSDFTANPITVSGNSGLRGEGATAKYGDVRLNNGSVLTVGGAMSINNTIVDGSTRVNFDDTVDIGKLRPATAGAAFTFVKGGPAELDLSATTVNNTLDNKATIGVAAGRLIVAGAQSTPASPTSVGGANLAFAGGTFVAQGTFDITTTAGAAGQLTEYLYRIGGNQTPLIDPIFSPLGLLGRTPSANFTRTNAIAGLNGAAAQTRYGAQDNLEVMWFGDMTFTTSPTTGNVYTFASNTDDGSTWWIDLDDDGKFTAEERVLDNNAYQTATIRRGVATVPPGTHRVALAAYEGGDEMLFEFKLARGDVADWNAPQAQFVDPSNTSIATYRARTYAPLEVVTPSFSGNTVTISGDTTVESLGASQFGAATFESDAVVNLTGSSSKFASATVAGGTGRFHNAIGPNRFSVGGVSAAEGATLAFSGADSKVTGAITGAGAVQVNEGVLEFTATAASTSTGILRIQRSANLGGVSTIRFAPGAGNTFGAAGVTAVANEGLLHAASGTTDLSGAVVTTTSVQQAVRPGLLETTITGAFNLGPVPAPADFSTATYKLDLTSANTRDSEASRVYPTDSTQVYTGEINIPDTDGDGRAGPIAFGEHFDDGVQVKIAGQTLLENGAWNVSTGSGEFELAAGNPAGWYPFEARLGRGSGANGQQTPWDVFGIGIDVSAPFLPRAALYRGDNGENDATINNNESQYVKPEDNGSMNRFRFAAPLYGEVRVDAGATLKVGAVVGANQVNIAEGARLQLNGPTTSKVALGGLNIAGTAAAPTGTLDVGNSAIVLDYPAAGPSPADDVRSRIIAGRGVPGLIGTWDGNGITSSASAVAPDATSIGYAINADLPLGAMSTFRGQPVDPTSVLIRHTRNADATLDGVVGDDDVTILGAFYAPGVPNASWANGDFDYNGFVDDDDVTLLGAFYAPSDPPIPAPSGGGVAAVPEPSTWLMLTLGGLGAGLFGWRRRRKA
jgi:hypothetical protein